MSKPAFTTSAVADNLDQEEAAQLLLDNSKVSNAACGLLKAMNRKPDLTISDEGIRTWKILTRAVDRSVDDINSAWVHFNEHPISVHRKELNRRRKMHARKYLDYLGDFLNAAQSTRNSLLRQVVDAIEEATND